MSSISGKSDPPLSVSSLIDAGGVARFEPLEFNRIEGWETEDHVAALSCFRISARRMAEKPYTTKKMGVDAAGLARAAIAALALEPKDAKDRKAARRFFETWFLPHRIIPSGSRESGFVTGYFEPEIPASPIKTDRFPFPILSRPKDLVAIDDTTRPDHLPDHFFFARKTANGLFEYPDRRAIEEGALDGQGLELFWLESRIDIFFIHIQGSARLLLPDGTTARISYAGKSGHRFTAIGKLLIERGELTRENVTMHSIRDWLEAHPAKADDLMRENRSFIFFQIVDHPRPELGPVAAAGVPLTPGRSMAVDHRLQTFGTPIWVATKEPVPGDKAPFGRLMIAQDTGSAITGPARGDLYIGTGEEAGRIAGAIKHSAEFIAFLPVAGAEDVR